MKRTAITLLLIVAGAMCVKAQTMYDALTFSENDYEGTARTMAMGNAFTALGGDLGSVNINPAGSAVANYSQVTLTPGLTISVNSAQGTSDAYFGDKNRTNLTRFDLPNVAVNFNFKTNRVRGIRNWSLGLIVNKTGNYVNDVYASGLNSTSTFSGSLATLATGYSLSDLTYVSGSYDPYYDSDIPSDAILGFESNIYSNIEDADGVYAGVAENIAAVTDDDGNVTYICSPGGKLNQQYRKTTLGYKYDYVINWGANISDIVYVGVNLGITDMSYRMEYIFRESTGGDAADYHMFETQFQNLKYNYQYSASGVGVYGKFGLIVTPGYGLRFGAAIQTPTSTSIHESWGAAATVNSYDSQYCGSASTPTGEYTYRLVNPMRVNAGAAYTFGIGLVSVDYEMVPYGTMYFKEVGTMDNSTFDGGANADIKNYMGTSHTVRAGVEIKPVSLLAVRLGYGLTTSPEKYLNDLDQYEKVKANKQKFSFGLGYSSRKSFFADIAVQATRYAKTWIYPYDYYGYDNSDNFGIDYSVDTPEILSKQWMFNVALTLGFRF